MLSQVFIFTGQNIEKTCMSLGPLVSQINTLKHMHIYAHMHDTLS